jgi:hypothetical protein
MVCRSVQVERPSCSTSGGQSEGSEREDVAAAGGVEGETLSLEPGAERAMAIQEETEVQERHLWIMLTIAATRISTRLHSRLPIRP